MSVAVIRKQGTTLNVRPECRLDTVRSPQLDKEMEPYMTDVNLIVMDFANVEYVSSSGLRLLMCLQQEMEKRGGEVQVLHVSDAVLNIFSLVGFMDVVHVIDP